MKNQDERKLDMLQEEQALWAIQKNLFDQNRPPESEFYNKLSIAYARLKCLQLLGFNLVSCEVENKQVIGEKGC